MKINAKLLKVKNFVSKIKKNIIFVRKWCEIIFVYLFLLAELWIWFVWCKFSWKILEKVLKKHFKLKLKKVFFWSFSEKIEAEKLKCSENVRQTKKLLSKQNNLLCNSLETENSIFDLVKIVYIWEKRNMKQKQQLKHSKIVFN